MLDDNFAYSSNKKFDQDKMLELIIRAQNEDKDAKEILIKINFGLINKITNKFLNRGYEREDIFQIGSIGLIKAINNFKPEFNTKFSTYAVPMIMGEIKRFIRDDGIIKVNRNLKSIYKKVHYAKEKLAAKLSREPTLDEISKELKIEKEEIVMALEACYSPDYLFDVIHHEDGSPIMLIDKIPESKDKEEIIIDRIALKDIVGKLPIRERQIVVLRYFQDKTQTEVAKVLNISQVQVSRIEKKIINFLKANFKD